MRGPALVGEVGRGPGAEPAQVGRLDLIVRADQGIQRAIDQRHGEPGSVSPELPFRAGRVDRAHELGLGHVVDQFVCPFETGIGGRRSLADEQPQALREAIPLGSQAGWATRDGLGQQSLRLIPPPERVGVRHAAEADVVAIRKPDPELLGRPDPLVGHRQGGR